MVVELDWMLAWVRFLVLSLSNWEDWWRGREVERVIRWVTDERRDRKVE